MVSIIRISWILSAFSVSPRYVDIIFIFWILIAFHGYRGYIRILLILILLVTLRATYIVMFNLSFSFTLLV